MDLNEAIRTVDFYHAEKAELKALEKEFNIKTAPIKAHIKASETLLMNYLKENNIKVVVSPSNVVEVKARKSTTINLKKLFAYSLGKLKSMKAFLAVVKPQVGKVKALYDTQALTDKGILKVVVNDYHHLEVSGK